MTRTTSQCPNCLRLYEQGRTESSPLAAMIVALFIGLVVGVTIGIFV